MDKFRRDFLNAFTNFKLEFKKWIRLPILKKFSYLNQAWWNLIGRVWHFNRLFFFIVFLPTFMSVLYYGVIASDVYISESQFVVRGSRNQNTIGLGVLFGGSFTSSQSDSYSVGAFMLSRDAVKQLDEKLSLRSRFNNWGIDVFNRFPGLTFWSNSFEALHKYYQKHVSVYLDTVSSISILKVRAYTAEDAHKINEELIHLGEELVNKLNVRARQDMLNFSTAEMSTAEEHAREASRAFAEYRNKAGQFNQTEYERLLVEKTMAIKELEARHAALVQAKDEARKQELYLDRIVQPNKPDYAEQPLRLKGVVSTLVLSLILWSVLSMMVAGVREHYD